MSKARNDMKRSRDYKQCNGAKKEMLCTNDRLYMIPARRGIRRCQGGPSGSVSPGNSLGETVKRRMSPWERRHTYCSNG